MPLLVLACYNKITFPLLLSQLLLSFCLFVWFQTVLLFNHGKPTIDYVVQGSPKFMAVLALGLKA